LKVGWGKPSPLRPDVAAAVARGASRNVFIGQADESLTEETLADDFKRFGEIDKIDVLTKKQIAFVHFSSINAAMQAVETLPKEEKYVSKRLSYGRDRAAYDRKGASYGNFPPSAPPTGYGYLAPPVSPPSPPGGLSGQGVAPPMFGAPSGGEFNRTIYIGGLHADTTYSELLDVIRGGPIASCKILPEKNCAFVTFVDPESALNFHRMVSFGRDALTVHNQKVKVGWGKPGPLPPTVVAALARGATRNVYLGGIEVDTVTESKLESDLAQYGIVEKVNVIQDKAIAFINFTSIQSAVKGVAALRQDPYYSKFKINYGKDRCARF